MKPIAIWGREQVEGREADPIWRECFLAAGAVLSFSTNFEPLLQAANSAFLPHEATPQGADFDVRLWVDHAATAQPPWPKPYARGLDHLVFLAFDSGSSVLIDLRAHRAVGRLSQDMAADTHYCASVVFPMMLSVLGASVGIAEVHAAGVAKNGQGMLLAGPTGSGKSTLALALAHAGFGLLSDDRTYCSQRNGVLHAWGLPTELKLRLEACQWFVPLRNHIANGVEKGEPVLRFEPGRELGIERIQRCEPRWVIVLEREETARFELTRISADKTLEHLEEDLMAELPEAVALQRATLSRLSELSCWRLNYGGGPHAVATELARRFGQS